MSGKRVGNNKQLYHPQQQSTQNSPTRVFFATDWEMWLSWFAKCERIFCVVLAKAFA